MPRFERAKKWTDELIAQVRNDHFPDLGTANLLILLDGQKSKSRGSYVPGKIKTPGSLANSLIAEFSPAGVEPPAYDFVIILDKEIWMRLGEDQRFFLVHWPLCHVIKDVEDEAETWKLTNPDYPVFAKTLNHFESDWKTRFQELGSFAAQVHEAAEKPPFNDPSCPRLPLGDRKAA